MIEALKISVLIAILFAILTVGSHIENAIRFQAKVILCIEAAKTGVDCAK